MSGGTPAMIINLPPARPEDVATPNDLPGTPNSGTTTMSELSTVAIKDGHRGHLPHPHNQPFDAERADRISRLAGLDRTVGQQRHSNLAPGSTSTAAQQPINQGYFDANNTPHMMKERSTVGSASATESAGGRTTWASGSDVYDHDKMSEDQDVDNSSMGGFSEEGASLVAFGEGARTPARQQSQLGSPVVGKATPVPHSHLRESSIPGGTGMTGIQDARMIDGVTYDHNVVDTTSRQPQPMETDGNIERGAETTERLMRERYGGGRGPQGGY